jgi:acyl-coenzyme A synthetase/AMP-(fatty) acid ligase
MALSCEERLAAYPPRAMSNRELWRWRVAATPDRRYLWFDGRSWSYAELDVEVRQLAAGLRAVGVGSGTRVLVGISNRAEAVQTHLALMELGAVCVPLIAGMPFDELAYRVVHCRATVLVADDPIASQVLAGRAACPDLAHVVVVGEAGDEVDGAVAFAELAASAPLEPEEHGGDDLQALAHVIYTSGSTGRPKGVMLKAGAMHACGLGYADCYGLTAQDTYFLPVTLGHSLGAIAGLGIPMVTGGAVALVERFRPSHMWGEVRESGATISVLFPAHLNLLLEADDGTPPRGGSSLRLVVTHADNPPFRDRFGVELATIWGMTETLACVGSEPGYAGGLGPGYVGRPFVGGEVGVFDERFRRLGPGEYGEICMRHPQAMIGYLDDPEATSATLVDGWVRSGDRGMVDHGGRAYFAGRYKAMIKRSGENVSAEEVEEALCAHPDVAECVVVGVPDRLRTEEVGAVVARSAGAGADPAQLRRHCTERLAAWKAPRYVVVRDEPLPRLGNGKIDRMAAAALLDPERAWDATRASAGGRSAAADGRPCHKR